MSNSTSLDILRCNSTRRNATYINPATAASTTPTGAAVTTQQQQQQQQQQQSSSSSKVKLSKKTGGVIRRRLLQRVVVWWCSFSVSMSIPASLSCTDRRVSHNVHAGCSHACVQFQARAAIAVEDGIVVRHAHAGPGILAPAVHCFLLPRSFRPLSWLLGAYAISEAIPEDQASAALSTLAATSMPSIWPSSVCPCSMLTIMSGSTS